MAKQITHHVIDDLTGEVGAVPDFTFVLDGVTYQIDLTEGHIAEFRVKVDPYIRAARNNGRMKLAKSSNGKPSNGGHPNALTGEQRAAIRQWWQKNQAALNLPEVSLRGRIPTAIVEAYQASGGASPAANTPAPPVAATEPFSPPAPLKATGRKTPPADTEVLGAFHQVGSYAGVADQLDVSVPTATKWVKAALARQS